MAVMEKLYEQHPSILWNLVNDIVEMRKGKIKEHDKNRMTIDTEMYGIKTRYVFSVTGGQAGGAAVTVETEGESEDDRRSIELMFATLENMLGSFEAPTGGGTEQ